MAIPLTAGWFSLKRCMCLLAALSLTSAPASAQVSSQDDIEWPNRSTQSDGSNPQPILLDSGWVEAAGADAEPVLVYSGAVSIEDAMWVRLHFQLAVLSGEVGDLNASYIVLTSALDGATQSLWAEDLAAWADTGAYFNGDTVLVDVYASPIANGRSRVRVTTVEYGEPGFLDRSLCGDADDRLPSTNPAIGRLLPTQCTAWLMNNKPNGFLTAGHCAVNDKSVVQFNVPESTVGGSMVHPDPADQYPVDEDSIQHQNGSISNGNDWLFFGTYDNISTGLSPYAAQGSTLMLVADDPIDDGRPITVTGFGQTSQPMALEYNYTQLTHTGVYAGGGGNHARYIVDTTGGDSGAPVIDATTGEAIAVHTNGGCNSDGWNRGTRTTHPHLRSAIASPLGMAAQADGVQIVFHQGRPSAVKRNGGTLLRVRVRASDTREPVANTVMLHVNDGNGWTAEPMEHITGEVYRVYFPAMDECVASVAYFVSVENSLGETNMAPFVGAEQPYQALVVNSGPPIGTEAPEQSHLWSIGSDFSTTAGAWELAPPPMVGRMGPTKDFDLSGVCLLTGADEGEDLDGGLTFAVTPVLRTNPGTNGILSMAVWYSSSTEQDDGLHIDISVDGGGNWVQLDHIRSTDGWEMRVYPTEDYVTLTEGLLVRFVVSDDATGGNTPDGGIVEAAIDQILISNLPCDPSP